MDNVCSFVRVVVGGQFHVDSCSFTVDHCITTQSGYGRLLCPQQFGEVWISIQVEF